MFFEIFQKLETIDVLWWILKKDSTYSSRRFFEKLSWNSSGDSFGSASGSFSWIDLQLFSWLIHQIVSKVPSEIPLLSFFGNSSISSFLEFLRKFFGDFFFSGIAVNKISSFFKYRSMSFSQNFSGSSSRKSIRSWSRNSSRDSSSRFFRTVEILLRKLLSAWVCLGIPLRVLVAVPPGGLPGSPQGVSPELLPG